ncbi:LANO_0H01508g1_1 [Lachancea nothofagi CBS 11611]|uniref:LANO_0H01508g1_1 n=1 Tax=Lachancea nothofagi CBS 11611 TaxID=1266666 RepID=A0A1G4KL70_9SACH|nr:LANO_0H01508g1_1 [Lachancea nothofagi CBS 11611]
MPGNEVDPAVKLADDFKKRGYFDEAKNNILCKAVEGSESVTLEDFVRDRVSTVVSEMVKEDESLIFKNRGSTSALIEGQLLKNDYDRLSTDSVDIRSLLQRQLDNPEFKNDLKTRLRRDLETADSPLEEQQISRDGLE